MYHMIIRRPLALITCAFVLGIGSYYIFTPLKLLYVGGIFFFVIGLAIYLLFNNDRRRIKLINGSSLNHKSALFIIIALLVFNLGGLSCHNSFHKVDGMESHYGTDITYSGYAIKYQQKKKDFHKVTVKNGQNKYLLYIYGEGVSEEDIIGSTINFTGTPEEPSERRNPGCFDYKLYLQSLNINTIIECEIENIKILKPDFKKEPFRFFYTKLTEAKCRYLERVSPNMSTESYAILNGMLFGNKSDMDEDMYEAFQKNGIAHILSVSGIHVGIVYGFIYMLLRRRLNLGTALILFVFIFVYAFLAQFSPSVTRASIMIIIHIFSKLLHRPYDLLTGSSLAALLMLIHNPLSLFHVGFQLSFLAIVLLAFLIPYLSRYVGEKKIIGLYKGRFRDEGGVGIIPDNASLSKKVINSLLPLVVIQFGMAPFTAFVFNHFSMAGIFLNIPIIFIAGLLIPIGIILIPISLLPVGIISNLPLLLGTKILDIILIMMVKINENIFSMTYSSFHVVSPPAWALILIYGLLFFFASETFRIFRARKVYRVISAICVVIVGISILCSMTNVCVRDNSDVVFIDVGQGDAIHVRTPSGKNVLIDGGGSVDYDVGKKVLLPYLLKNGVGKIDYAFVTHLHTDHFKGVQELSNYIEVDNLITYDGSRVRMDEIISGSGFKVNDIAFVSEGDKLTLDDEVSVDVLFPEKRATGDYMKELELEEDENKNSLLMKLHYGDSSILITGDLDEVGERIIIDELGSHRSDLKSTILKVGHHGSKYSTSDEFLEYVNPMAAVIQVSEKNNYGHPAPQVIEKLEEKDIMIYRNDMDGAIMLRYHRFGHEKGKFEFRKQL